MIVNFLETARLEFDDSVEYYNQEAQEAQEAQELGIRFLEEILRAVELIVKYPEAWPQISERTRRCKIKFLREQAEY